MEASRVPLDNAATALDETWAVLHLVDAHLGVSQLSRSDLFAIEVALRLMVPVLEERLWPLNPMAGETPDHQRMAEQLELDTQLLEWIELHSLAPLSALRVRLCACVHYTGQVLRYLAR
jgi:hypothetical protein